MIKDLSTKLKELRMSQNLSQADVAKKLEISERPLFLVMRQEKEHPAQKICLPSPTFINAVPTTY